MTTSGVVRVVDTKAVFMEQAVEAKDFLECVKLRMLLFKTG
jgi:hypothetical protein